MEMPRGSANSKFLSEQAIIMARMNQADGGNNSSIGLNGEILIREFLNKYIPPQFTIKKGHYRAIDGTLSREIDIMILDSRFPLLNETENGIVHAIQHALVATIEVKRSLGKDEIMQIRNDTLALETDTAQELSSESDTNFWTTPTSHAIAFRSKLSLDTLARHFFQKPHARCFIHILEHPEKCRDVKENTGAFLFVEGPDNDVCGCSARVENPLSDFYYMLLENCYSTLSDRKINEHAIRDIIISYYNWSNIRTSFKNHRII